MEKGWSELAHICPVNIDRLIAHGKDFDVNLPSKVTRDNLDKSKENLFLARSSLDSMIATLIQILYDKDILKEQEDKILFAWLIDNFGRFMKRLDDQETNIITKHDSVQEVGTLGIAKVSSYAKVLRTAADAIIYESLLKAITEYDRFVPTEKIKKEPRIFFYMLFQILHITLSVMGGLTRESSGQQSKRGMVQNIPTSWQSLMTPQGQEVIKEAYKEDTGIDIDKFGGILDDLEDDLDEEEREVEEEIDGDDSTEDNEEFIQ